MTQCLHHFRILPHNAAEEMSVVIGKPERKFLPDKNPQLITQIVIILRRQKQAEFHRIKALFTQCKKLPSRLLFIGCYLIVLRIIAPVQNSAKIDGAVI